MTDCLNARGFLVEASGNKVLGSSPGGVNFTLTIGQPGVGIDDSGNPGAPPRRLSQSERAAIETCARER